MTTISYYNIKSNEVLVYIGELKFGWQFLFYPHPEIYNSNKRGINRFLKLHKHEIYVSQSSDSSNSFELISVENFWKIVRYSETGLDIKTYYNYPDCLKFYDHEIKQPDIIVSKEDMELYNKLPKYYDYLESLLLSEYKVDNLRWKEEPAIIF